MPRKVASSFTLQSVDHDRVLIDSSAPSSRHLLSEEEQHPLKLKLSFTVDGEVKESLLHRSRGAFAEDSTITLLKKEGSETVPAPETYAYYSEDKNWVLTFHENDKFDGLVFEENGKNIFHFVAENGEMKINGDIHKIFPNLKGRQLTSEANGIDYWDGCHDNQRFGLSGLDIGAVAGNVFFKRLGERGVVSEISSYLALSNTIYERQMDIRIIIKDFLIATEPDIEDFLPGSCTQSIQTQLQRMAFWTPPSRQVLWHLFDDCFGSSGGILGIAYLGTLCSSYNVGVSYYSDHRYDDDEYPTWATVAHELGHNFDAQHSFEEGQGFTGGIMDYGYLRNKLINGEVQFNSKYREREVCREVNSAVSRRCLDAGVAPSPTAQFTTVEEASREIFAASERSIRCARHVHKMPLTGDYLKRFSNKNRVQCQKECALRENCSGYVFNREDGWCELQENALSVEALTYTAEFDTFFCAEGELPKRFTIRQEDDLLDEANSQELQGECCATTAGQGYLGLNLNFRENLTQEQCNEVCVRNSRCEAATFNPADSTCMLFGGRDFSHKRSELAGVSTISCDRACISAFVVEAEDNSVSTSNADLSAGAFIGVFLAIVALVAFLAGYSKLRKASPAAPPKKVANAEGDIYQATL